MAGQRKKRKPMSEINVVPYIDVMLVLLIIFMVTAPMLMQGVEVDLPDAAAAPVDNQDAEPLIVSINGQGQLFLNLGVDEKQSLALATIQQRVGAVLRRTPEKPVLIWGDTRPVEAALELFRVNKMAPLPLRVRKTLTALRERTFARTWWRARRNNKCADGEPRCRYRHRI